MGSASDLTPGTPKFSSDAGFPAEQHLGFSEIPPDLHQCTSKLGGFCIRLSLLLTF